MTALVRCPKCGQMEGIRLYHASEGMTDCQCAACGRVVCTCPDGDHDECWNAAGAHAQALRDRVAALEAALRGLVGVKDMRLRLIKLHEMGHGTDYTDYYRLKPLAWAAARAALEQMP